MIYCRINVLTFKHYPPFLDRLWLAAQICHMYSCMQEPMLAADSIITTKKADFQMKHKLHHLVMITANKIESRTSIIQTRIDTFLLNS